MSYLCRRCLARNREVPIGESTNNTGQHLVRYRCWQCGLETELPKEDE